MTKEIARHKKVPFKERTISLTLIIDLFIILYITSVYTFSYNELNYISRAFALILMGLLAIYVISKRAIRLDGLGICMGLFTLVCLLSCVWAVNTSIALSATFTMAQLLVLVVLLYNYIQKEDKIDWFVSIMCIAATIFSVYTVLYFGIEEYFFGLEEGLRMGTEINNVNAIGMTTASAFLLNLWCVFYKKKWIYSIPAVICLVVSLGSGSRTAVVGMLCGTLALFLLKGKGGRKLISFLQCAVVLLAIYFVLQLPAFEIFMERMDKMVAGLLGDGATDHSSQLRFDMIELGLETFKQRPLTGLGVKNSNAITMSMGLSTYLHNNYVELLATVGIFGTLFYYLMYLLPLGRLLKPSFQQNQYAIVAVVLIGVNLIFHFGTVDYYNKVSYLYLILAWLMISKTKGNENGKAVESN